MTALFQFAGFGLSMAAFIYGLATDVNGKCTASHLTYCQVFRITVAFDVLVGYASLYVVLVDGNRLFQLAGFVIILMGMRPAQPKH